MSRIANYKKCWECGAEAGIDCIGEDGKPALEVCDGRVLRVPGDVRPQSLRHVPTRMDAPPDSRPQAKSRRERGILTAPETAPCAYCGTPTRLWGAACATGKTWCAAPACQTDRKRAKWARERAAARAKRPQKPAKVRPCVICGADVSAHGVTARTEAACPGACREARWRQIHDRQNERARRVRADQPAVPCYWCNIPLPRQSRREGERACCGSPVCRRTRDTAARAIRRARIPPIPDVACHWCAVPIPAWHRSHGRPCCGGDLCQRARSREKSQRKRLSDAEAT